MEIRVIDVISDDWQQIPQPRLDLFDLIAEFGEPVCELTEALRFKRCVVRDDVSMLAESFAKRTDEISAGIFGIGCKELEVVQIGSGFKLPVDGPLKRNLMIRPRAFETWNRRIERFEIHEVKRVLQAGQFILQGFADPRPSGLDSIAVPALNLRQREVFRNIVDRMKPALQQSLESLSSEVRQKRDVVLGRGGIATAEEFTFVGIFALIARLNIRCRGIGENGTLFRQELRNVKLLDFSREVRDREELAEIVLTAVVNVVTVEMYDASRRNIETVTREHVILNGKVVDVVLLRFDRRLHLDQPPSTAGLTYQNVRTDQNASKSERSLEDRRNRSVFDQRRSPRQRGCHIPELFCNECAPRESSPSQQSDFSALFESRVVGIVQSLGAIWLIHLKIKALQALNARDELRLGYCEL